MSTSTYIARRMAYGGKTHLASEGSSVTACGAWSGNTRQYATEDKTITCSKCAKSLAQNWMQEAREQGFVPA